jgi:hypothetical protein
VDRLTALIALRAKLELRGLLRARETALGLLLMVPGLLFMATAGSAGAFFGIRHVAAAEPRLLLAVVSMSTTILGAFWVASPLLAGVALTETHDVGRLLHFPISQRTLVLSSLVSNCLQPAVAAGGCIALAAALALARRMVFLPFTLVGVFLSFLLTIAAAQAVGLFFQGLARNRRWHDIALFLGVGIGFLISLAPVVILSGGGRSVRSLARTLLAYDVFALSPFAWGARAAVHAARGQWLGFAAFATAASLAVAAAIWASSVLIERMHRTEIVSGSAGVAGHARMTLPGALGALVEKDLRAGWRDPTTRAALFMGLVGPLVLLTLISRAGGTRSGAPILMLAMLVGLSPFGGNAFGLERRGLGLLMSFPVARWKVLLAKNLSALTLRLPGVAMIVAAGLLMAPLYLLPSAVTVIFVTLLLSAGADNFLSILFPTPAPPPGGNPYAGASGSRGLGAAMIGTVLLGGVAALAAPFAFLAWLPVLLRTGMIAVVALPLAIAGAASVYAILVLGAERLLLRREPELLERVLEQS